MEDAAAQVNPVEEKHLEDIEAQDVEKQQEPKRPAFTKKQLVIMAAGAFVSGSSIELSADAPIREPYSVYFQGGLTWPSAKLGILMSLQSLKNEKLVDLTGRK